MITADKSFPGNLSLLTAVRVSRTNDQFRNKRREERKQRVGASEKLGIHLDRGELLIVLLHALVWEKHFNREADLLGVDEAIGVVKAQDIDTSL